MRLRHADPASGTLSLYGRAPDRFGPAEVAAVRILARHVLTALTVAGRAGQLRQGLRSRHTIGVALGMVMQRYGLDEDAAFDVLRRYSMNDNVKVHALAARLVELGGVPDGLFGVVTAESPAECHRTDPT